MHETEVHGFARTRLQDALEDYFKNVPDVYIASRMVLAYKRGDPKCHRDPDILVARGVAKHRRHSFRVWEEGVVPCVLFEIASRGGWRVDLYQKPIVYANIGVKEYFLFDSEGCYLDPVLQGFRTVKGKPVPRKPAAAGSLVSKQLGLRLVSEGEMVRLIDMQTGKLVLTKHERLAETRQQAEQYTRRADAAAAEVVHLRAELERRRRIRRSSNREPLCPPSHLTPEGAPRPEVNRPFRSARSALQWLI
jgi:Uma2 family endonuclease